MPQVQVPMVIMRGGVFDVRVRASDIETYIEKGWEKVGKVGRDGKTEYDPGVAEKDMKAQLAAQAERAQRARANTVALGQASGSDVDAELRGVLTAQAAVIDELRAELAAARAEREAAASAEPQGGAAPSAAEPSQEPRPRGR